MLDIRAYTITPFKTNCIFNEYRAILFIMEMGKYLYKGLKPIARVLMVSISFTSHLHYPNIFFTYISHLIPDLYLHLIDR